MAQLTREQLAALGIAMPSAPPFDAAADAIASALLEKLRRGRAVPVRQSAAVTPPFYATPLEFRFRDAIATTGAGNRLVVPVSFIPEDTGGAFEVSNAHTSSSAFVTGGVPRPFQSGMLGVVWVSVNCARDNQKTMRPMTEERWSLLRNGAYVNGFLRQMPGGMEWGEIGAATNVGQSGQSRESVTSCPIYLAGNNTLEIVLEDFTAVAATTILWDVRVSGWQFPDSNATLQPDSYLVD